MQLTVYKNEKGYSTLAKNKNDESKLYISINFKKGEEPVGEGRLSLDNVDGFFTCYKGKDEVVRPVFFVMSYTQELDADTEVVDNTLPF